MILLENNLIYVATPKTATQSVKKGILDSGIHYTEYLEGRLEYDHYHVTFSEMITKWGYKDSFCVERDWFERWYSGFSYLILGWLNAPHLKTTFKLEDVNNNFIYSMFDIKFSDSLYSQDPDILKELNRRFVINTDEIIFYSAIKVLCSSTFWKSNKKCTYEFKITELDKLADFLSDRFGKKVSIPHINDTNSKNALPNVIINDELKSFIHQTFEKVKSGGLI